VPVTFARFSNLTKHEFSLQMLAKALPPPPPSKTKFHENPSSGSRVVPHGPTDGSNSKFVNVP